MKCSICIAAYDKPRHLERVLQSVCSQDPPFDVETIVVDDGTPGDSVSLVCRAFPEVVYHRIDRAPGYRNPAAARRLGAGPRPCLVSPGTDGVPPSTVAADAGRG